MRRGPRRAAFVVARWRSRLRGRCLRVALRRRSVLSNARGHLDVVVWRRCGCSAAAGERRGCGCEAGVRGTRRGAPCRGVCVCQRGGVWRWRRGRRRIAYTRATGRVSVVFVSIARGRDENVDGRRHRRRLAARWSRGSMALLCRRRTRRGACCRILACCRIDWRGRRGRFVRGDRASGRVVGVAVRRV